ncbi:MAG: hypothetical protein KQH83_07870 [Actinobacteria bacterium]|nr:hypothetical protein [Actinomycetota bacterium]
MGQPIEILSTTVTGDVAMIATDRGVTGQAGASFRRDGAGGEGFPALLAAELFAADDAVGRVFVASNQVVVERAGGWDDAVLDRVRAAITAFFVFYAGD